MEVGVALLRGAGLLSLAILIGGSAFLLLCSRVGLARSGWAGRLERSLLPLWGVHIASDAAALAMRAALVAGDGFRLLGGEVETYALGTHAGRVAVLRLATGLLMVFPLIALYRGNDRRIVVQLGLLGVLIVAAAVSVLGPLAGHAAADDQTRWLVPIHMAHLLAISTWLGALPFWVAHVVDTMNERDTAGLRRLSQVLMRFSRLAMACMIVLVGSGTALAWTYVEDEGDLFGTHYGVLLCGKILLLIGVLAIANHMRLRFLPALTQSGGHTRLLWAARSVSVELLLAVVITALGVLLAQTTPAIHDQPVWPFGRRLSVEATWPVPGTAAVASVALVLAVLAAMWLAAAWQRLGARARALLAAVMLTGGGTVLWNLSVPAYPDTYRRSTVPYLTISIAQGMQKFPELCASCHGAGGLGDGPLARTLPRPSANLSEPHTALHTAGDMFWWMTHGFPESGMPGFAEQLDEQSRWDMINFLRAFSQGFQARIIGTSVAPNAPWLGAPNFYFESDAGQTGELKDYRERSNVLLVFLPDGEAGNARAEQLAASAEALRAERTEILLISADALVRPGMTVVRHESEEIRRAYDLLSRTVMNRGDGRQLGMERDHMEFLIDRFGYIRARWIPGEASEGWQQPDSLLRELKTLNREPRILPPPDDHVH